MQLIRLDLNGNEISLHSLNHVLIHSLEHVFEIVLISDQGKLIFCSLDVVSLSEECILNLVLFFSLLLQFFLSKLLLKRLDSYLKLLKFLLFLTDQLVDVIVLDPQLAKS